jgi:hypothetical protein
MVMSYALLDDQSAFHRKTLEAGNAAYGAWVRMLTESNRTLSDGRISKAQARAIATPAEIKRLLFVRFLELRDDGDYDIHDFLDWNRSAAEVRARQAERSQVRADAGRKGAAARWGTRGNGDGKPMANAMANDSQTDGPLPLPIPRETEEFPIGGARDHARVESDPSETAARADCTDRGRAPEEPETSPPPAPSSRDAMGDESLGGAWADALATALGHSVSTPRGGHLRHLVQLVADHIPATGRAPSAHQTREAWVRNRAAKWASGKPEKITVFAFGDWLNSGQGAGRGAPKGRARHALQPLPPKPPNVRETEL